MKRGVVNLIIILLVVALLFLVYLDKITGGVISNITAIRRICTDSDDGDMPYVKGTVFLTSSRNTTRIYTDKCYSWGRMLIEYYCYNNLVKSKTYRCENGCKNGACIPTVTCTDSDGGLNYYVKGTARGIWAASGNYEERTDSCASELYEGRGLSENFCLNNSVWSMTYDCPNGCEDGACVNKTITDGCNLINDTMKAKIRELQGLNRTVILKEGEKVKRSQYAVIPGYVLEVRRIYNATGYYNDEVRLRDVSSGVEYTATITAEGSGSLYVGRAEYLLTYSDDRTLADDEYIILDFPQTSDNIKMTFYC